MTTIYTADDAIEMMRNGGINLTSELSNPRASFADITDEIEQAGGEWDFTFDQFLTALRGAVEA